jgi:SAM-dependent methyltransferase
MCALSVAQRLESKAGLEIGGPSLVFSDYGAIPLYRFIKRLDNVVFSEQTIWEGHRQAGRTFIYARGRAPGNNFILEATALTAIADQSHDFVLASHCLEHIANPLRALKEWQRVLKSGGHLLVILPDRSRTFDHRRPITTLDHMIEDFERGVGEDDRTHLEEILALHDLPLDPPAGTFEQFKARSLRNPENRCLHHHVFTLDSAQDLIAYAGFEIEHAESARPIHLIILAHKG